MDLPEKEAWPGPWGFVVGVVIYCWVLFDEE